MRVKLNTAIYIHNVGSIPFGKEAELDNKLAKELIASGVAVEVIEEKPVEKKDIEEQYRTKIDASPHET